jgi:transcriptional regulator with XRE-family HTH domain
VAAQPNRAQSRVRNLRKDAVPTAQRMVVGRHLRAHREALGLTQKQVAGGTGFSESKISRVETGQHDFKPQDISRLCDTYRIIDPAKREQLADLAAHANRRPWWQDWSDVAGAHLQAFVSFEDMAQRIRTYEPQQLCGLLQTEDYARAVIELGLKEAPRREVERLVELRRERRERFEKASPKRLICVIDETTLIRSFGSAVVLRRQLDHLIALTENPRYTMRIAELNRCNVPVMLGMTTIFDFAESQLPDIVYAEHFDGAFILQEEQQVDRRKKAFDRLQDASLSPKRSAQRLRDLRKKQN